MDKFKKGVSMNELEGFASKHMTETFSVLALVIASVSSAFDFFTGPKLTILFLFAGTLAAILLPVAAERGLKQLYTFTFKQEKVTEIILGAVKVLVAIFIPFLFFGLIGLLAGTSYHYYIRHAQIVKENQPKEHRRHDSGDEHD